MNENAKELWNAAVNIGSSVDSQWLDDSAGFVIVDQDLKHSADTLAHHIMSTVCEDDDEPIDSEWFNRFIENKDDTIEFDAKRQMYWDSSRGLFVYDYCDDIPFEHVKTRGQLRQLCKLLGFELKEVE